MCKSAAVRAGIDPKRVWPHVFRHSYCTYMLQQNVSPAKVMHLLGHSSMEMVMQVYNQLRPADAMDDVSRALTHDQTAALRSWPFGECTRLDSPCPCRTMSTAQLRPLRPSDSFGRFRPSRPGVRLL